MDQLAELRLSRAQHDLDIRHAKSAPGAAPGRSSQACEVETLRLRQLLELGERSVQANTAVDPEHGVVRLKAGRAGYRGS